jgi:hypothetical protein
VNIADKVCALESLEKFPLNKAVYSKFCVNKLEGNLFMLGSTPSEQNYSGIMNHLRVTSSRYNATLQRLRFDLLNRHNEEETTVFNKFSQETASRISIETHYHDFPAVERDYYGGNR